MRWLIGEPLILNMVYASIVIIRRSQNVRWMKYTSLCYVKLKVWPEEKENSQWHLAEFQNCLLHPKILKIHMRVKSATTASENKESENHKLKFLHQNRKISKQCLTSKYQNKANRTSSKQQQPNRTSKNTYHKPISILKTNETLRQYLQT